MGVPRGAHHDGQPTMRSSAADEVKVTYVRYQAHASSCGDWSCQSEATVFSENKASPNFRLCDQHNLAAMVVADPRDLVNAKNRSNPADAQRRLTVAREIPQGRCDGGRSRRRSKTGAVSTTVGGGK